jgi:phage shock protein A
MNDLFKKLNVLLKAGINDLLGEDSAKPRRSVSPEKLGKDIDREIVALRERINDALAYEDELQAQVQTISEEVTRWDKQADDAVTVGSDSVARHAIDQMQGAQKRLAMAESDLHEHRIVTQELIQRVNLLDAVVADAHRVQAENAANAQEQASGQSAGQVLSDVLRDARQKIASMGDIVSTRQQLSEPDTKDKPAHQAVDDDLARRRERLSKPK